MLAALVYFQHLRGEAIAVAELFCPEIDGFFHLQRQQTAHVRYLLKKQNSCRNWSSDLQVLADCTPFQEGTVLVFYAGIVIVRAS